MNIKLTVGIITFGLMLSGCSSKKASPPASSKPKSDECDNKTSGKSQSGLRKSFGLASSTYEDIKEIIDDECVTCHVAGGVGGLDLSNYKALKENAAKVILTINADDDTVMPPDGKMKSAKIDKVQLWVDDGKLGDSSSSDDEDEEENNDIVEKSPTKTSDNKANSSDCDSGGSSSSNDDDDDDLDIDGEESGDKDEDDDDDKKEVDTKKEDIDPKIFDMYIETTEMKNCFATGKTFLRTGTKTPVDPTPRCDVGVNYPAQFTCTKTEVLAAFKNDQTVVTAVETYLGEGYLFDQCGEAGGKPVVYFVCFAGEDDKCVAKDKLTGNSLTIKTVNIGRP